jgi:hypothetical protein
LPSALNTFKFQALLFEAPSKAKWTGLCQMQVPQLSHQCEDPNPFVKKSSIHVLFLQVLVDKANAKRLKYAFGNHEEVGKAKKLNRKIRKRNF